MQGRASVRSLYGRGDVDTDGYAVGATMTYTHDAGLYVDSQFQYGRLSSDLRALDDRFASRARGVDANGWSAAVESGWRIPLSQSVSVVPNVRLAYTALDIDNFRDSFDADVRYADTRSLQLRGGVTLEGVIRSGGGSRTTWFVGGSFSHEFMGDPTVRFATLVMTPKLPANWVDGLVGFNHSFDASGWNVFGNAKLSAAISKPGDNYSITGRLGVSYRW